MVLTERGNFTDGETVAQWYSTDLSIGDIDAVISPIICLATFFTNLCTVVLMGKAANMKTRTANVPIVLVLALSGTDLLIAMLGESFWLFSHISGTWLGGLSSCQYTFFVMTTLTTLSKSIVVLMGIERFLSIRKPFYYEKHIFPQTAVVTVLILFFYSFINGVLLLFGVRSNLEIVSHATGLLCFIDTTTTDISIQVVVYWSFAEECLLTIVLIFCNIAVLASMKQMKSKIQLICPRKKEDYLKQVDMINGIHAEFSRLMIAITVVFLLTIIPLQVRMLCNQLHVWPSPMADYITYKLALSNSMINPFIYGLTRRHFRKQLRKYVLNAVTCCRSNRINTVNISDARDYELRTCNNTLEHK